MLVFYILILLSLNSFAFCESESVKVGNSETGKLIEQGRTFVHHAVKRFMVILPAIFFKLGIAFTLLLIVTLVAVNNGFIGFLLLVVGMSSVLARLQEARRPIPIVHSIPTAATYHHNLGWERSDKIDSNNQIQQTQQSDSVNKLFYTNSPGYYIKYGSS